MAGLVPHVDCWLGGWCMQNHKVGQRLELCMVVARKHAGDVDWDYGVNLTFMGKELKHGAVWENWEQV